MRTIAIVNQKGGCGKTTTAINLASLYAARGLRTLLVDMDPQSHCAAGLGVPEARIESSIGDALIADHSRGLDPASLTWEVSRNLHLAPSTMRLAALEAPGGGLHQLPDRDRRLESLLAILSDRYDRCLIDCPPTIGLLTFNALRAARETIIPVQTEYFALQGAQKQWTTIQRLIKHIDRPIACHLLATLHNPDSQLAQSILGTLRREFAGQIIPAVIHEHEVLREAASFGQPIIEYAPHSEARRDFDALVEWLEAHAVGPAARIEVMAEMPSAGSGMRRDLPGGFGLQALDRPGSGLNDAPPSLNEDQCRPLADRASVQPHPAAATAGGGRAGEMARRMQDLAMLRSQRISGSIENPAAPASASDSGESNCNSASRAAEIASRMPWRDRLNPPSLTLQIDGEDAGTAEPAMTENRLAHLFGVHRTTAGVLFVQPGHVGQNIAVSLEGEAWSPQTPTPLRFNPQVGVHEAVVELPPGIYRYRLNVDGKWVNDPYNASSEENCEGREGSVLIVPR